MSLGALEFVVARITDIQLDEVEVIVAAEERQVWAGHPGVKQDIDFHTTLLRATANPILLEMSPLVIDGLREGLIDAPMGMFRTHEADILGHRALLEALRRRDLDQARKILRVHITQTHFPDDLIPDALRQALRGGVASD